MIANSKLFPIMPEKQNVLVMHAPFVVATFDCHPVNIRLVAKGQPCRIGIDQADSTALFLDHAFTDTRAGGEKKDGCEQKQMSGPETHGAHRVEWKNGCQASEERMLRC